MILPFLSLNTSSLTSCRQDQSPRLLQASDSYTREAGIGSKEKEAANEEIERLQTVARKRKLDSTSQIINCIFRDFAQFWHFSKN